MEPNKKKLNLSNLSLKPNNESRPRTCKSSLNLNKAVLIKINDEKEILIEYEKLTEGKILGSGEFGIVKKMTHQPSKLEFAVKILNEEYFESKEDKRSSFNELKVSMKIGNESEFLIKFFGALYVESSVWILTELMDTSLERYYTKAFSLRIKLPESLMVKISLSVLNALLYLKNLNLLHRDIKPSNILINSTGEIKVCDFGISGFMIDSICNTWKGCQLYMAPEKIRITSNGYNIKSDIWSFGISLIEIITGIHPYSEARGPFDLTTRILENESPQLDDKKYSKDFCSFIDCCLKKDPNERWNLKNLLKHSFLNKPVSEKDNNMNLAITKLIIDEIKQEN